MCLLLRKTASLGRSGVPERCPRRRPPEPYKGKGIKYIDEVIRRKVGKTGK